MPHLCSFGCKYTPGVVMHHFPNPDKFPERFKAWVNLVGGKLETSSDYYKKKMVCDIHFIDDHRNRYKRLNALAVPTLHLHGSSHTVQNIPATTVTTENEPCPSLPTTGPSDTLPNIRSTVATGNQPCSSIPVATDESYAGVIASAIAREHNYSVNSNRRILKGAQNRKPLYPEPAITNRLEIRYLRSEICRLRKKGASFKQRLETAQKFSEDVSFQRVIKRLQRPAQIFLHMQLQSKKKPKGRRFTIDEKILSLSLYKKSPKAYKHLCSYFSLPSIKAMKRLLGQIKLTTGINPIIFERIKKTMTEKDAPDRLCSLIFDEVSLTANITYNAQKDEMQGFANNKPDRFANHALVFMVKGVKRNFKQPVAYYFTNALDKIELKKIIKTVVKHVVESGLIIVNTVCDQSTVNVGAITELVQESRAMYLRNGKVWRNEVMHIAGQKIIPLYDVPHLIKGVRNNLLTKDLIYTINNRQKIVKWEYFQMTYAADKSYGELRLLDKITEEHVNPEKINKMRVKNATQIFSHSMAVVAEHLTARGALSEDCRQIIDITLLLDNLFDTLNGSTLSISPNGKIYKGPVKQSSPHHHLWKKAKEVLKIVKFIKKGNVADKIHKTETTVPSVTNFIKTIEGMEALWELLSGKYKLDAMLTRNFNQDPLENFFGNIRSYGARNVAPNSVAFEGAYKALMLNNYRTPHSRGANCEEDVNECLQTLEFFVKEKMEAPKSPDVSEGQEINFNKDICLENPIEADSGQRNYVCGWVLKKCLTNVIKKCQQCRKNVLDNRASNEKNTFIKAKEYQNKKWLCYPNEEIEKYFEEIQAIAVSFLKSNMSRKNIKHDIIAFVDMFINFSFKCTVHKENLKKYFLNTSINVLIYSWCRSVNRILSGKITYNGDDETKLAAQSYFNRYRHYKNKK